LRTSVPKHLKSQHGIDIKQQSEIQVIEDVEPAAKRVKTIADFLIRKQSSRNCSRNGYQWSFDSCHHQYKFIRDSVASRGFRLPANESGVMNLLLQDYDDKKTQLSREIQLKQEFTAFARIGTGTRTDNLQKVYNALLFIKSTSSANWY
jgi:hypothetical protein